MGKKNNGLLVVITTVLIASSSHVASSSSAEILSRTRTQIKSRDASLTAVTPSSNQNVRRLRRNRKNNQVKEDRELQNNVIDVSFGFPTASPQDMVINEVDLDVHELTGGPFIGPQVYVEPRIDRAGTNNNENTNQQGNMDDLVVTKRIVGGYDAEPHSFHSMLLLKYGGGWRWAGCGGTLISNCHVLTAAHCAADPSKQVGAVMVNAHRPYAENGNVPFHFSEVEHVIRHGGFNETTNANDVAIIKMNQCVNTTEFPPAIPADPRMANTSDLMADILGFGKLSEQGNMFVNVETLQIAKVPVISHDNCSQYYGERLKTDMFCGGFAAGGSDACQGDSGSSMTFVNEDGNTVILGVISWGVGCGRSQSPGVYASVQYHFDWISRQVCGDPDTSIPWCRNYSSTPTASPSLSPSSRPSVETVTVSPSTSQPSPSSQNQKAQKERTATTDFYTTLSLQETNGETEFEDTTTTRTANLPGSTVIIGQDHGSTTFWDPSAKCQTTGYACNFNDECCSGICQQISNDSGATCISQENLVETTKRKRTARGIRKKKHHRV